MKQRLILCILVAMALVVFAFPRLTFYTDGMSSIFAFAWISFALLVILGNITGLLYSNKQNRRMAKAGNRVEITRRKRRSYSR